MKIITKVEQLESERVTVWYPVSELTEIAEMCARNPDYEPVLMYNARAEAGILFLLIPNEEN